MFRKQSDPASAPRQLGWTALYLERSLCTKYALISKSGVPKAYLYSKLNLNKSRSSSAFQHCLQFLPLWDRQRQCSMRCRSCSPPVERHGNLISALRAFPVACVWKRRNLAVRAVLIWYFDHGKWGTCSLATRSRGAAAAYQRNGCSESNSGFRVTRGNVPARRRFAFHADPRPFGCR